jgi:hypothetical protein
LFDIPCGGTADKPAARGLLFPFSPGRKAFAPQGYFTALIDAIFAESKKYLLVRSNNFLPDFQYIAQTSGTGSPGLPSLSED